MEELSLISCQVLQTPQALYEKTQSCYLGKMRLQNKIFNKSKHNCGQHVLKKNMYFIMGFTLHFQICYERLDFCEFSE